jgi:hypothetical protein
MPNLAFAAVGALCAAEGPRLKRRRYSRVTPIWVLIVAPRITRYLAITQNQRINDRHVRSDPTTPAALRVERSR